MAKPALSEDELELQALRQQVEQGGEGTAEPEQIEVSAEEGAGAIEPEEQIEKPGPGRPPKGYVPHQSLHEERIGRKAEAEARQKIERDFAEFKGRAEERLRFLTEAREQAKAVSEAKPQAPDFTSDPIGALKAQNDELRAQYAKLAERDQRAAQQTEAQQRISQGLSALDQEEHRFASSTPDYFDAAGHLANVWVKEATNIGGNNPALVERYVQSKMMEMIQIAQAIGKSPAEVTYAFAKERGYALPAPTPDPDAKLDNLKRGTAAARTLSGGAAPAASQTPVLDMLMNMTDDEMIAYSNKNPAEYAKAMSQAHKQAVAR